WIRRKIEYFRAFGSFADIVFFVSGHGCHGKTFDIGRTVCAVSIYGIVNRPLVTFFEYGYMDNVFSDKDLVLYFGHAVFTILTENNDIVYIRTFGHEFILLHACTDKAFSPIDIQFGVGQSYVGCFYLVEYPKFRFPFASFGVFGTETFKPSYSIFGQMSQVFL